MINIQNIEHPCIVYSSIFPFLTGSSNTYSLPPTASSYPLLTLSLRYSDIMSQAHLTFLGLCAILLLAICHFLQPALIVFTCILVYLLWYSHQQAMEYPESHFRRWRERLDSLRGDGEGYGGEMSTAETMHRRTSLSRTRTSIPRPMHYVPRSRNTSDIDSDRDGSEWDVPTQGAERIGGRSRRRFLLTHRK
ncbi:hypothetical protein QCA50_008014 [Cerrena zonata]|uniref:Uncharacterized protein n=1 Tax=Cerrena zonata TaxID=2478898 RepID=A0AAW0G569_9APHY